MVQAGSQEDIELQDSKINSIGAIRPQAISMMRFQDLTLPEVEYNRLASANMILRLNYSDSRLEDFSSLEAIEFRNFSLLPALLATQ